MVKNTNDLFGKNYPTRPGASVADKCSHDPSKTVYKPREPKPSHKFDRMMRPGLTAQPPSKHIYDFEQLRAEDILKFGTKVHIDDKQFEHTFKDENGQTVTKNLTELSYEVGQKLSELQEITKLGDNAPLDDKMNILNTMIDEIRGKFAMLSPDDMKNISKIVAAMGDKLEYAENLGFLEISNIHILCHRS
jgi:hypothetical protein